jgi:hypothetical protein
LKGLISIPMIFFNFAKVIPSENFSTKSCKVIGTSHEAAIINVYLLYFELYLMYLY